MDNDIDIEEHDVMDNPALRNVFPDLSILKKEILAYDEGDQFTGLKEESETEIQKPDSTTDDTLLTNISCVIEESPRVSLEENVHYLKSIQPNMNNESNYNTKIQSIEIIESSLPSNKIILGSKPNKIFEQEENNRKHHRFLNNCFDAEVVLENLGPFLNKNHRYCKQCLILFPEKHSFDVHLKSWHTNLDEKKSKDSTNSQNQDFASLRNKNNKCNICGQTFASFCNLKRHIKNIHKILQNETDGKESTSKREFATASSNSCFHCKEQFPTQKSLIEHLYEILQSKVYACNQCTEKFLSRDKFDQHMLTHNTDTTTEQREELNEKIQNKNCNKNVSGTQKQTSKLNLIKDKLYRCSICFYYFKTNKFYFAHMAAKHKITKYHTPIRESFKPMCKICLASCKNMNSYNSHIHKRHKRQLNQVIKIKSKFDGDVNQLEYKRIGNTRMNNKTTENLSSANTLKINCNKRSFKDNFKTVIETLVLQSALFKCLKCDINFLSAKAAMLHANHMDMLINWKCTICQKIFKKENELLHLKQHSFSQTFDVYNLSESALSNVLYKCLKCGIHFNEDIFLRHYLLCDTKPPNSVYCKVCDLLVGTEIWRDHDHNHKHKNLKSIDFTVIDANLVPNNVQDEIPPTNNKIKQNKNIKNVNGSFKVNKVCNIDDDKGQIKSNVRVTQDSCIAKRVKLHYKNNKITNTKTNEISTRRDFDIESRTRVTRKRKWNCCTKDTKLTLSKKLKLIINTNEFAYIYCDTCKCCVNAYCKQIHLQARCGNMLKYVCKYCGLIFTNKSINTHRKVHHTNKTLRLQNFKFYSLKNGERISPPITEFPACNICNVQFVYKIASQRHECDKEEYLTCQICNAKLSETAFKLHMSFHNYSIQNTKSISNLKANKKIKTNQEETKSNLMETEQPTSIPYSILLYTCVNCNVTVDTYDKVVEHCHEHYDRNGAQISTKICTLCNLKFNKESYASHEISHANELKMGNRNKILEFDPFYFISKKTVWIKHIFKSFPQAQVQEILNNSIYKVENKIKMEIFQQGPSDLTIYKCLKCRCVVDPSFLIKHIDVCPRVKKHPCTFCDLLFSSSLSKIRHEKVHKCPNITLKSYRIIYFNNKKDEVFNKDIRNRTKYVLYQCRNCNGIVDKCKLDIHKCDKIKLKKCIYCGLLLYNNKYDSHIAKHENIDNFDVDNIKVILFGEKLTCVNENEQSLLPSFAGTVHDYVLFKCNKCNVCLKNIKAAQKHNCSTTNISKPKCPVCHFNFFHTGLVNHSKLHESDPDFIRENIKIIPFENASVIKKNLNKIQSKAFADVNKKSLDEVQKSNDNTLNEASNKENTATPVFNKETVNKDSLSLVNDKEDFEIENKTKGTSTLTIENIYKENEEINDISIPKCTNKLVITEGDENIKYKTQNSARCQENSEITSTSKDLMRNNIEEREIEKQNKSNITELNNTLKMENVHNNENKSKNIVNVKIYKCTYCDLHFLNESSTISHLEQHVSKVKICKQSCPKCQFVFTPNGLFTHLLIHHGEKNVEFKFVIEEISKK